MGEILLTYRCSLSFASTAAVAAVDVGATSFRPDVVAELFVLSTIRGFVSFFLVGFTLISSASSPESSSTANGLFDCGVIEYRINGK